MSEENEAQETTTARPAKTSLALALVTVIIALGAAYSIWNWRERYNAKQVELTATQWVSEHLLASRARIDSEHANCQANLDAARSKQAEVAASLARLEDDLGAAQSELAVLQAQRDKNLERWAQFKKLSQRLNDTGGSRQWGLKGRDGRMLLELPAETLFEPGAARLSRAGEFALMEVAIALRQLEDRKFMIAGHTDSRPLEGSKSSYRNNWELSTARALTVLEFFLDAGVPAQNLRIAGYGDNDPAANNRTPQGRQKNRRIEIELLPHPDELPWLFENVDGPQPASVPAPTE